MDFFSWANKWAPINVLPNTGSTSSKSNNSLILSRVEANNFAKLKMDEIEMAVKKMFDTQEVVMIEVSEDELAMIPDDLRPKVTAMLNNAQAVINQMLDAKNTKTNPIEPVINTPPQTNLDLTLAQSTNLSNVIYTTQSTIPAPIIYTPVPPLVQIVPTFHNPITLPALPTQTQLINLDANQPKLKRADSVNTLTFTASTDMLDSIYKPKLQRSNSLSQYISPNNDPNIPTAPPLTEENSEKSSLYPDLTIKLSNTQDLNVKEIDKKRKHISTEQDSKDTDETTKNNSKKTAYRSRKCKQRYT